MSLYRHVFYSWLLSIAITLAGLFFYDVATDESATFSSFISPGLIAVAFISCIVASPSLLIAFIFFRIIRSTRISVYEKFLLWYLLALAAVVCNLLFVPLFFGREAMGIDLFLLPWPAYAGVIAALTIRYRYFLLFFRSHEDNEETIASPDSQIDQQTIL